MTDTIIKGTGNSRSLRTVPNALTLYPDFQSMMQAMIDGSFPIDIGPTNSTGIEKMGTDLTKANILTDATEQSIWGNAADRTPNEAFAQLRSLITTAQNTANQVSSRASSQYGSKSITSADPFTLNFSFSPRCILLFYDNRGYIFIYPSTTAGYVGSSSLSATISWSGSSVSVTQGLLTRGTFYYFAIS